jgi:hypothetical protein
MRRFFRDQFEFFSLFASDAKQIAMGETLDLMTVLKLNYTLMKIQKQSARNLAAPLGNISFYFNFICCYYMTISFHLFFFLTSQW